MILAPHYHILASGTFATNFLTEPLNYSFVHRAILAASIMALVAGLLSCWLVLIGWSLLGDAISHAILPGVVIAYSLSLPYAVGAVAAALVAVWLVGTVREQTSLKEDTSIGIVFTAMFALGLVLISVTPAATHMQEILFGNLLGISDTSLWQIIGFGGAAVLVIVCAGRAFTLWAFDANHAHTVGFNTRLIRWLLLGCMACVVVASVQAVGVILVVAMLITPGATAYLLTRRMSVMLVLSPAVALLSALTGIWLSFNWDVSTGGTIVLVQAAIFTLVYLFAPREGVVVRRRRSTRSSSTTLWNQTGSQTSAQTGDAVTSDEPN